MVDLESNYDTKPMCLRSYPVPRVHQDIFKKEIERRVILGIIEHVDDSKWGSPHFPQPKKNTNCVQFLKNSWNLNGDLNRNPYPI